MRKKPGSEGAPKAFGHIEVSPNRQALAAARENRRNLIHHVPWNDSLWPTIQAVELWTRQSSENGAPPALALAQLSSTASKRSA
jgi:hypothetical protein